MDLPHSLKRYKDDFAEALAVPVPAGWDKGTKYIEAGQPAALAAVLIDTVHDHLHKARIAYLMREDMVRGDRVRLGTAAKASAKIKFLTEYDFVIEFNWSAWTELSVEQRIALVDHELCHCAEDDEGEGWKVRHHDVEEFGVIVQRWGLWQPDLERFGKHMGRALAQTDLFKTVAELQESLGEEGTLTIQTPGRAPVTFTGKGRKQ